MLRILVATLLFFCVIVVTYADSDKELVSAWMKNAEKGDARAQLELGTSYLIGDGVPQDDVEAAKWCRKAAEQGLAEAQETLGTMYYNGTGVSEDYHEAAKWNRKAAEQGYARAQFNLGVMYEKGKRCSLVSRRSSEMVPESGRTGGC